MTPPWMTALDTQLDILRFWQSDYGARYAERFQESWDGGNSTTTRPGWIRTTGEYMMRHGTTYYVSPDMMAFNTASIPGIPGHPLRRHDLMSPSGFVLLPRPFTYIDVNGEEISFRAFGWTTGVQDITVDEAGGVVIFFYTRKGDWQYDRENPNPNAPLWDLMHFNSLPFESADWDDTEHWRMAGISEEAIAGTMAGLKFVVAFWAHIKQEILKDRSTVITRQGWIDKPTGKRAKRAGFKLPEHIRLVTLRREYDPTKPRDQNEESVPANYSHRFWVGLSTGGFWRWQYYPSRNCHERIHIAPFLKGDPSLPIEEKDSVNYWKR